MENRPADSKFNNIFELEIIFLFFWLSTFLNDQIIIKYINNKYKS